MKVFRTLGFIFGSVGLVLLIATVLVVENINRFINNSKTADGTVTELRLGSNTRSSRTYHPVFRYTPEGGKQIEVVSNFGSNPPRYKQGQTVTVRYDPDSPYRAKIDGFWSMWFPVIILAPLSMGFLTPGLILLVMFYRKRARLNWLRLHGRVISTDFQAVMVNTAVRINGQHPYQIVTRWQNRNRGVHHTFKSDYLMEDPAPYVEDGRAINVRIDPNNPKLYNMDLTFLPQNIQPASL